MRRTLTLTLTPILAGAALLAALVSGSYGDHGSAPVPTVELGIAADAGPPADTLSVPDSPAVARALESFVRAAEDARQAGRPAVRPSTGTLSEDRPAVNRRNATAPAPAQESEEPTMVKPSNTSTEQDERVEQGGQGTEQGTEQTQSAPVTPAVFNTGDPAVWEALKGGIR